MLPETKNGPEHYLHVNKSQVVTKIFILKRHIFTRLLCTRNNKKSKQRHVTRLKMMK